MPALKLCVICGEPTPESRCEAHRPEQPTKASSRARGYTAAWDRLSLKARKLQPWCSDCGSKDNLTADHLRWPARSIRDVDVTCMDCNIARGKTPRDGSARPQRLSNDLDPLSASQYQRDNNTASVDGTDTPRASGADRRTKDPRGMAVSSTQSDTEYAFMGSDRG